MQVTITIDGRALRRATFSALALGGVLVLGSAHASSVTIPNAFTAGTQISAAQMNANFAALETAVDDNDARLAALEARFAGVTRSGATLLLSGMNLQLVSGDAGSDTHVANGNGNLIIGYNTGATGGGSHNLVIGDGHTYASTGGAVIGGAGNTLEAAATRSVIVGGSSHVIEGVNSVIVGGTGASVVDNGAAGDNGNTVTIVGSIAGTQPSDVGEDNATAVGTNCTGIAVGLGGAFVEIGFHFRNFMGIGFCTTAPTTQLSIGGGQANVGVNAPDVNVNAVTGGLGLSGNGGVNVTSANGDINLNSTTGDFNVLVQDAVNIGDNASAVNLGNGAGFVIIGNNVPNSVNLGAGASTVNVGQDATAFVQLGVNAPVVNIGNGATTASLVNVANGPGNAVSMGQNAASVNIGQGASTVFVAPNNP